jgi:UPF0042 nucleotide-binding protein
MVLITGPAGSGKTTALHALEDVGYFCMDNVPIVLLPKVLELAGGHGRPLAAVVDARDPASLLQAELTLDQLQAAGHRVEILWLEADADALIRRFRETRRRHPLDDGHLTLQQAMAHEARLLSGLHRRADVRLVTTGTTVHELKRTLQQRFAVGPGHGLLLRILSFGFKHGLPTDVDMVLDVRFLPNPHFDPELRHQTGLDAAVADRILHSDDFCQWSERALPLLRWTLPRFEAEGRVYTTLAIGCTGGQHRSVAVSEFLARTLDPPSRGIHVAHRDRARWATGDHEPDPPPAAG